MLNFRRGKKGNPRRYGGKQRSEVKDQGPVFSPLQQKYLRAFECGENLRGELVYAACAEGEDQVAFLRD